MEVSKLSLKERLIKSMEPDCHRWKKRAPHSTGAGMNLIYSE